MEYVICGITSNCIITIAYRWQQDSSKCNESDTGAEQWWWVAYIHASFLRAGHQFLWSFHSCSGIISSISWVILWPPTCIQVMSQLWHPTNEISGRSNDWACIFFVSFSIYFKAALSNLAQYGKAFTDTTSQSENCVSHSMMSHMASS